MNLLIRTNWTFFLRAVLYSLAALPAIYILIAIQYSAITVPFWDHTELIKTIASWHDGSFRFSDLWAPHNHTRPLVYRFVMLFNAVLTDWDIRSEYIYMYLALYGTFACHIWALRKVTVSANSNMVFPLGLLIISLVLFSPVGHNNHWWSMMFQLNATNLFIAFGLLIPFIRPQSWSSHLSGALSCWFAAFTLTNGLFAMLTVGLVFQLTTIRQQLRPNRWSLFWAGNLFVLLAIYLPGISVSTSSSHPNILQLAQFSLAYLGAPLGGLLWFPYQNMFDIPISIMTNVVCGTLLLTSCAVLCWRARTKLDELEPEILILFGFSIFAIMSALITGWGRAAFDDYGVSNGNSSRYTIFGAYLMLGQLYYLLAHFTHNRSNNVRLSYVIVFSTVLFVFLSAVSYSRAVKVYIDAGKFSQTLMNAYPWGGQRIKQDKFIHPNPEFVSELKYDLQRLELGPYKQRQFNSQELSIGEFKKAGLLSSSRQLAQRFTASEDGLKAVTIKFVTPNGKRTSGSIEWEITKVGEAELVFRGTLDASKIKDWGDVRLKLPYIKDSKGQKYQLALSSTVSDEYGSAVALYKRAGEGNASISIYKEAGLSEVENLSMALRIDYTK